jgi:hypothetical protein
MGLVCLAVLVAQVALVVVSPERMAQRVVLDGLLALAVEAVRKVPEAVRA